MILPAQRLERLSAAIRAKAGQHPELDAPVRLASAKAILARERIDLLIRRHPLPAQIIPYGGTWTVVVDDRVPSEARAVCICHELAHLWLHHDRLFARWETAVVDVSPDWWTLLEETEADAFANLLITGPSPRKPEWPRYAATYVPRARVLVTAAGACPECGGAYGTGHGQFPKAADRDMCVRCVLEIDPPMMAGD